ncbi:DUF2795 domain-containing protein [Pseudonocardia nigra]|uniref:DUF2795 domain-containing protein n=1 Tax=Pseudonocardia nigra TaxID=1921578 RepID=UPI001C5D9CB6|nr:DUF2795 domain-containing protein [Pseudonocardia nigra]
MYRKNPGADAQRISQVLAGITYPAAKWQLIMQAEEYGADAGTRAELWALPTGTYADLAAVITAVGLDRRPVAARYGAAPAPAVPGRLRPLR